MVNSKIYKSVKHGYNMKKYGFLLIALFVILILPFVSAEIQTLPTQKVNTCITIPQTCSNCTFINITKVKYPNTTEVYPNIAMLTTNSINYYYSYCDLANQTGSYIVTTCGDVDGVYPTCVDYDFPVTTNGEENTMSGAILYIGLIAVLTIFLIVSIHLFMKLNHLLAKVGFFGLSYLIFMALVFIAWNLSSDFLTSAPFLTSFFRILFFVLIIGVFPLIISSFAWYFIMLFKIKEIERLMTKGFSLEDAEKRTGRKYK